MDRVARPAIGALTLLAMALPTTSASAQTPRSVYLNGENIDGVAGTTFKGAEVRIDALGNVHIQAPGHKVERVAPAPARPETPAAAALTRRYWLVSQLSRPGATRYDEDVFLNNRFVRRVRSSEGAMVLDVTEWLQPGAKTVHFRAAQDLTRPPLPDEAADFFKLMLGEGTRRGEQVVVEKTRVDYALRGAEMGDRNDEQTFTAE